ncbi:nicotinate phosphoribosyltransferase [Pseudoflavitalea sp. G-6-1-2]|uniref:nicotinate phosphoribosyltransferase n=1 Tax=Pseudoflavitalea sp. G-6-1-2 TaxID=2728841 RepID=UPI00146A4218|nr:nicotinate phosphoribosyltransferase [Pseudoflavitalea sp. G-6-1-2]NML22945.1 nicotinate phosphoribosyltransferase [Pseudoflavitalea sp. G-6-1-2]
MLSFSISGSYTDLYQLTMGEVNFLEKRHQMPVAFDYFFRKVPSKGGYVVFAGLSDLLEALQTLHFTKDDITYLRSQNFNASFIEYLENFRFTGTIYSVKEGEIVFPYCPIIRVEGNWFEAQLAETLLLNLLNFESLIATKASRMRYVAGNRILSELGLRRAQGLGGLLASKAAAIGGFDSTSNVYAAQVFNLTATGTMAHAFVTGYDSELEAFRAFARSRPAGCIFLADTYNTLQSGIPNAIIVAKEMEQRGQKLSGVRLDSGDLAYLSRKSRAMLDQAGLQYVKIVASNQLDEYVIKSLLEQGAPIDVFGVGTSLVTGAPDAALDGVFKLSMAEGKPRMKISETLQKATLPGIKQVNRVLDEQGHFFGADAIVLDGEMQVPMIYHPFEPGKSLPVADLRQEPLLKKVMEYGKQLIPSSSIAESAAYCKERLALLPAEYKRFENPHVYKTSISKNLMELRDQMINAQKPQ